MSWSSRSPSPESTSNHQDTVDVAQSQYGGPFMKFMTAACKASLESEEDNSAEVPSTELGYSLNAIYPNFSLSQTEGDSSELKLVRTKSRPSIRKQDLDSESSEEEEAAGEDITEVPDQPDKSIPEKLQQIFQLPEIEELKGEFPCWLVRTVLLPGYLYLTSHHVCFYASIPKSQETAQKTGFLSKRSKTTKIMTRYWFELKNDVLSWYESSTDLYYPIGAIDLKYALGVENCKHREFGFKIITINRTYHFQADTKQSMVEWINPLQKAIFRAKNSGDSVKIVLPLENVIDIEGNVGFELADTIRLKVIDNDESYAMDEYYFAYFYDTEHACNTLKETWRLHQKSRSEFTRTSIQMDKNDVASTSDTTRSSSKPHQLSKSDADSDKAMLTWLNEKRKSGIKMVYDLWSSSFDHLYSYGGINAGNCYGLQARDKLNEDYRKSFALSDKEEVIAEFVAHLLRTLPYYGKVYISTNHLCFKSRVPGAKVKLIIPLSDIQYIQKHKSFGYFFYGLGILAKSQEEVFLEFSSSNLRDKCFRILGQQVKRVKSGKPAPSETSSEKINENKVLIEEDLGPHVTHVQPPVTKEGPPLLAPYASLYEHTKPSETLHITCLTIGSRGDVQPYIALCKGLMKDGHKCRIATHAEYQRWIESHGIEFRRVGGDPGELMQICIDYGMFSYNFLREGVRRFRGWFDDLMQESWEACQGTRLLIESPSAVMVGVHIAEKLSIPYFRAFTMPWTRTRDFPHPFAMPDTPKGRLYNEMTYIMIDHILYRATAYQTNRFRKEVLDLPPTTLEKLDLYRVPYLYAFSPTIVPHPPDWMDWIHTTGYWFLEQSERDWSPPEDLELFLENARAENRPLVYIGFGSILVDDPDQLTETIIEAVKRVGVRAIVCKGWSARMQEKNSSIKNKVADKKLEKAPDFIYNIDSIPHDWLFPRIHAVVHHGGAGTTAAGLLAGVPTIIKPFFGDQFFWGDRIQEMGLGVCVKKLTVEKLADAILTVTTDVKIIGRARQISEQIRQENGVKNAIRFLYRDLEFARDRMKKDTDSDSWLDLRVDDDGEWTLVDERSKKGTLSTSLPSSIAVPFQSSSNRAVLINSGNSVSSSEELEIMTESGNRSNTDEGNKSDKSWILSSMRSLELPALPISPLPLPHRRNKRQQ
ncbi:uncharacterized protein VTP21DRAFT_2372 [Calcarisporiella thermophila]|uniref:uncharacterized protein n=1 Tax=Calcarisporiella thermophila TaxID=911321 RepID=UPI0037440429